MEDEDAGLILNALGVAVVDLIAAQIPITKDNLLNRLEHNRRLTGNVVGKRANKEAAELVKRGQ